MNGTTPTPTSTALVRATAEPQTMAELKDFAAMAAESQFFGCSTPQQALMIAMAGKDLGFSYTQSLRMFHIIKGKPSLSADGMVAAVLARTDICEYFDVVELTDTKVVYETKRKGRSPVRYEYTAEEARRAGVWSAMYDKHPKRMLSARCKAYLARDVYPDILGGLLDPDEAREAAERPTAIVQATVVNAAPSPATAMLARIDAAANVAELEAIAADIKRANVGEWDLNKLRSAYTARMTALTPPDPVTPTETKPAVVEAEIVEAVTTTREPGED